MPRPSKIDEVYEKVEYWTKLFMYNTPSWNNISPIVEIIRNLDKRCIISHKYGKGQNNIRMYSSQYNHLVLGQDIKKQEDYVQNIIRGFIKFIFIFSDSPDPFSTNLLTIAKQYKICTICYSNLDSIYYFYNYSIGDSIIYKFTSAIEVVGVMKELSEYTSFKKMVDLFPEFDLIPELPPSDKPVLDRCLEILKNSTQVEILKKEGKRVKKFDSTKPFYDPNLNKLKRNDYIRKSKANSLPEPVIIIETSTKQKMLLSQFFKKK